jgi:hypothetical protein
LNCHDCFQIFICVNGISHADEVGSKVRSYFASISYPPFPSNDHYFPFMKLASETRIRVEDSRKILPRGLKLYQLRTVEEIT